MPATIQRVPKYLLVPDRAGIAKLKSELVSPVSHIDLLVPLLADSPDLSVLAHAESWAAIKQHAGRYGVGALIAYAIRSHVTGDDRVWCDRVLAESWVRHERMLRHLETLVELFASKNIPVLCLKGPLLARRHYHPPFLRKPSLDLDLAVMEPDLPRACEALESIGYTRATSIGDAVREGHHLELNHPSRPHLELHFRLTHRTLGMRVDELFGRAVTINFPSGREAKILGAADQLLHLMLHLAQSRFGTLFHLYEIRKVCRAGSTEVTAEAIERAFAKRYCGVVRMMDIAFRARWNEPFIPAGVSVPKTWLNRRLTRELYREFEEFSLPGRQMSVADRMRARWLDFQLTDGPAEAWRAATFFLETARYSATRARLWKAREIKFASPPRTQ
jgi:hypothetical protein